MEQKDEIKTPKELMLIEGMKHLKVIEKRMLSNTHEVHRYSSGVDTEKEIFGSADAQKKEVDSRIQANLDLMEDYLTIKRRIDHTNLATVVTIAGQDRTLFEWLILKRKMAKLMEDTYASLTDSTGQSKLRDLRMRDHESKQPMVVRYFDERTRNEKVREWQELYNQIDARLEVINATTKLVELQ